MHRNVTYNNKLRWVRFSPAGFGKDANGYMLTVRSIGSARCQRKP